MTEMINLETVYFLTSILYGVGLLAAYDALRIFRKLVRHMRLVTAIEDIVFWLGSSVLIFHMMYQKNNGIIRGFAIMGMVLGMIVYNQLFSGVIVKGTSGIINKVIEIIQKIIKIILSPFRFLLKFIYKVIILRIFVILRYILRQIKKIGRHFLKGLKKSAKTVKISLTKK